MKQVKITSIRRAFINLEDDTFFKWLERNNLEDMSIIEIGNYILENGCDAAGYVEKLKTYFIDYADNHTLMLLPTIERIVRNSNHDFINEDWDTIFNELFPGEDKYDTVVYAVNEFTDTEQISDNVFRLFKDYSAAKQDFNETIKNYVEDFGGYEELFANYDVYDDDDYYFRVNDPVEGDFYEFKIEKVPIR